MKYFIGEQENVLVKKSGLFFASNCNEDENAVFVSSRKKTIKTGSNDIDIDIVIDIGTRLLRSESKPDNFHKKLLFAA